MNNYFKNFSLEVRTNAFDHLGSFYKNNYTLFRVWAPNAVSVSVVGDFNSWDSSKNQMRKIDGGVFEVKIKGLKKFDKYLYLNGVYVGDNPTYLLVFVDVNPATYDAKCSFKVSNEREIEKMCSEFASVL